MKVYLVWDDNGEMYEDHTCYLWRVCSTEAAAKEFLHDAGYIVTQRDGLWVPEPPVCMAGYHLADEDDGICKRCPNCFDCDDRDWFYDSSSREIEEWEVDG